MRCEAWESVPEAQGGAGGCRGVLLGCGDETGRGHYSSSCAESRSHHQDHSAPHV